MPDPSPLQSLFTTDFGDLLADDITVYPATSLNSYGEPQYGEPRLFKGRFNDNEVAHRTEKSLTYTRSVHVYLEPAAQDLRLDSKVLLPDGSFRPIRMLNSERDEYNNVYAVIAYLDSRPPKS